MKQSPSRELSRHDNEAWRGGVRRFEPVTRLLAQEPTEPDRPKCRHFIRRQQQHGAGSAADGEGSSSTVQVAQPTVEAAVAVINPWVSARPLTNNRYRPRVLAACVSVECLQFARRLPCEFRASGLSSRSRAVGAGDDGEVEYVPGVVEVPLRVQVSASEKSCVAAVPPNPWDPFPRTFSVACCHRSHAGRVW